MQLADFTEHIGQSVSYSIKGRREYFCDDCMPWVKLGQYIPHPPKTLYKYFRTFASIGQFVRNINEIRSIFG